jgi:type I restriction enzyme S subunit
MILYSKIRPYLEKVCRPDFDGLCSADVYPLTPNNILNRDYLFFLLLSSKFTNYAIEGSGRAGMPKVNRKHLFAYSTFIPTIEIQKSFVEKLDILLAKTQRLETLYQQKLTALHELKQSILAKAFRGELTQNEVAA